MFSFKPKSLFGQALAAIGIVLVLGMQKPDYAQSTGALNPVIPMQVENLAFNKISKATLASIKIDTTSQYVGQVVEVPIFIKNDVGLGDFELEVDFPYQYLAFIGAERGEALSDTNNGEYTWEYMNYRTFPHTDSLYRLAILGLYDIPNGSQNIGVPLAPHIDYVSLVLMKFIIANSSFPTGTFLLLDFEWEIGDCMENTFQDPGYNTLYTSQDSIQFNSIDCPPESVENHPVISSLEFMDGGIYALYDSTQTGDINLNAIPYEVADWVLFHNFLSAGESILIIPDLQTHNSDVNCDSFPWSIADLLYIWRVILHESTAIPCDKFTTPPQSIMTWDKTDEFTVVSSSTHPGETVSVPIWLSNSLATTGITFHISFDSATVTIEGVDTTGIRIENWESMNPLIHSGELFFFAFPDWSSAPPFLSLPPGEGVLIKVDFRVDANVPAGTFLPLTFQTEPNLGHYNACTDTTGLIFVQPSTVSGWIYTDVIAGDANSDGILDVGDLVYLLNYLYRAGMPPSPVSLGDFNSDAEVNVSDIVALINYLFRS